MANNVLREPIQKRSIEKKEKIIKYGFDLICEKGYYKTNTAEIAKRAGVSTGIVYSYFNDKHDILLAGLKNYAKTRYYPCLDYLHNANVKVSSENLEEFIRDTITRFKEDHQLSQTAHLEITSLAHSDKAVSDFIYGTELEIANTFVEFLRKNDFDAPDLVERVIIILGLIDKLCHETVYHQNENINYDIITDIVVNQIISILEIAKSHN